MAHVIYNLCFRLSILYMSTVTAYGQRLHERGFICNRIVFDAVMPSVYTTAIEAVASIIRVVTQCSSPTNGCSLELLIPSRHGFKPR